MSVIASAATGSRSPHLGEPSGTPCAGQTEAERSSDGGGQHVHPRSSVTAETSGKRCRRRDHRHRWIAGGRSTAPGQSVDAACGPAADNPPRRSLGQGRAQQAVANAASAAQALRLSRGRGDGDRTSRALPATPDGPQDGCPPHEPWAHQRRVPISPENNFGNG